MKTKLTVNTSSNKKFRYYVKDTNPVRDLEMGIYLFCLDHAVFINKNLYSVRFVFPNKEDLLRRIWSRGTFIYKIKDEEKIQEDLKKAEAHYFYLKQNEERLNKINHKMNKLPKYKKFIIVKLRQLANYLLKKWID